MSQKFTTADLEHMISAVNDEGICLTEWELGFMESITEWFEKSNRLSDSQIEMLDRIYTNKVR